MPLSYAEEMRFTQAFLQELKLRISDKETPILPAEGKYYEIHEPNQVSYSGCLGPLPDPNWVGPKPPNSMGMVILVSPDAHGEVHCEIAGQFDVAHWYIPNVESMKRDLTFDSGQPRKDQFITRAYRRYTVLFSGIDLHFSITKCNEWVSGMEAMTKQLAIAQATWLSDPRVMRRCHLTNHGGAKLNFQLTDGTLDSQESFNATICAQNFDDPSEVLPYEVHLRGRLRKAPTPLMKDGANKYLLEIYLENVTSADDGRPFGLASPYLLDVQFALKLNTGVSHKVPHRLLPEDYRYQDNDGLPGYGITCGVTQIEPNCFRTDSMPTTAQERVDAPTPEVVGMTTLPNYADLASDSMTVLHDFLGALDRYVLDWDARLKQLEAEGKTAEREIALKDKAGFIEETNRIRDGVELLAKHKDLRQCFEWMNDVMAAAIQLQGKTFKGWHLFQLGFILTQIRSIYERHAPLEECQGSMDTADVLWFATGGGKTEAYLGIISIAMFYARVKKRDYGTTAWMRFPLRMLSVQQFQRLSYVLAQSNRIRQEKNLGGWPFTIGYFTGEGTPGKLIDKEKHWYLPTLSDEQAKSYQFISDCPYCGKHGSIEMAKDLVQVRLMHRCTNPECWSNTTAEEGTHGEGIKGEIGIYVSDEECYRYLPSVMVGTVDKLAVIGFNVRFAAFFGAAVHFCPEHGFSRAAKCGHKRIVIRRDLPEVLDCGNNSRTSTIKTVALDPMLDPGFSLLVQDELHLLSESLGNFDAHYETLLSALQISHGGRSPKILAATATIKEFQDHIHHLYLKEATRFPAPGVTQGESFYARKAKDASGEPLIRRWFSGVLPIGRGRMDMKAVAAISTRFLDQVDDWRTRLLEMDINLLSQTGLSESRSAEAIRYLDKNLNSNLIYANNKKSITAIQTTLEDENAKTGHIREMTQLDGQTRLDVILEAIHHVETKTPEDQNRSLIATSVVSHGVDIAELNFLVMAKWPKSTAEYIQASARCGRVHPGIVVCVLSAWQLFECGVFMNFKDYHAFLDRMVDSVPINRFAPNVLDRTLPGVLSAVIFNWAPQQPWGDTIGWSVSPLVKLLKSRDGGKIKDALKAVTLKALSLPPAMAHHFDPRVVTGSNQQLKDKVENALYELEHWPGSKQDQSVSEAMEQIFAHRPLMSFRDIEQQIHIKPANSTADRVLMALAR